MLTTAKTRMRRRSLVRSAARALLAGVALSALASGWGRAETTVAPMAEPARVTAPGSVTVAPPVGASDVATGAIVTDPAPPVGAIAPSAPVPTAPAPTVTALEPVPAAVTALLAEIPAASTLKMSAADREALSAFYSARQGEALWLADGRFNPKADAARARIAAAADDALDPREFKLPTAPSSGAPADIARAEVLMSVAALNYGRKAWGGRLKPVSVSPSITAEPTPFDAAAALSSLDTSHDVAQTLDGFNPQHPQFQELRKLLKSARGNRPTEPEHPVIGYGKMLEPGADDPRVPALRARFGMRGAADDFYYDSALQDAVIEFQKKNKIGASGLVNRQTLRALNAGSGRRDDADLIEINMERWRWMPRDLGSKHVFVDVPAFQLHIMQDGVSTYETRVIVGKSTNQTPIFSDAIDHIVVNPYWNVPSTIALKEMQNGSLRGFEVVDSRGKPAELDWEGIRTNRLRIRQPPGERNALGAIKFMFPNSHSVYLHDTSSRKLFANSDRALSHGCVRVDKPLEFADALSGDQGLSGAKLKSLVGGKEKRLNLATPIPVHLTYFTAWVGADGKLAGREDLYALDPRVRAALRGQPLPPLPVEAAPRVVAKAKPKPKPSASAVAAVAPAPQAPPQPQREGPGGWLARIFGDSR